MVLVDGEPGIGKSLLLRDATDEAAELGFSLATGAADQLGQAIPFFTLRAVLREPFAGLTADDPGRDLPDAADVVDHPDPGAPRTADRRGSGPGLPG